MKRLLFLIVIILFSCKKESQKSSQNSETITSSTENKSSIELGKELFEGKGNCTACHQANQKAIGPSVQEMGRRYKEKKGNLIAFLKEEAEPIVDPSQYEIMRANLAITKKMTEKELRALEDYIYSQL